MIGSGPGIAIDRYSRNEIQARVMGPIGERIMSRVRTFSGKEVHHHHVPWQQPENNERPSWA